METEERDGVMAGAAERIAWIGTGIMGVRMSARLLAAGRPLRVWNRSRAKTVPLVDAGAVAADSAAEACRGAGVVFLMLADGAGTAAVLFDDGAADALAPGALVVDMGSNSPSAARHHAGRLAERGIRHLDAPVSGGPGGAEQGTLAIMAGGAAEDFERARPLLERLGRPTLVGPCGAGQLAKLCNQTIVALTIGAVAEALLLAAGGGADPAKVRDALAGGFADSLILKVHGQRMLDRSFAPGGPSRLQLKDLRNILDAAREAGLELPLASHVAELYASLVGHGGGDLDHSALFLEIERQAQAGPGAAPAEGAVERTGPADTDGVRA
ncbi:MAG: NAD(P)-dependent oxidoreductase [Vicinamibacterales bacterium]